MSIKSFYKIISFVMAMMILTVLKKINNIKDLINNPKSLDNTALGLAFVNIKQFAELTGWSEPTVRELYSRRDFPSCDYGKNKIAEISAIKNILVYREENNRHLCLCDSTICIHTVKNLLDRILICEVFYMAKKRANGEGSIYNRGDNK